MRSTDTKQGFFDLAWLLSALRVEKRDPPIGSNRALGMRMAHAIVVTVVPMAILVAAAAQLMTAISPIAQLTAYSWIVLLAPMLLLWSKLSVNFVRGMLLGCLIMTQSRWTLAWLMWPADALLGSILTTLIFTPLILFVMTLMEGQRRGVIIGLVVALNMSSALTVGSLRPELIDLHLADARYGFPTFVVMTLYAFFVNVWSSQQRELEDAELQSALLDEQSNVDGLTGLLNRRGLELVSTGWMAHREPFGVLVVAIDHHDRMIESMGPKVGEGLIREVAQALSDGLRELDVAGRWGKNQFVLLSRGCGRSELEGLAQRMRRKISLLEVSGLPPMTVSVGIGAYQSLELFEDALERSKSAQVLASTAGGNCVRSLWPDEVTSFG